MAAALRVLALLLVTSLAGCAADPGDAGSDPATGTPDATASGSASTTATDAPDADPCSGELVWSVPGAWSKAQPSANGSGMRVMFPGTIPVQHANLSDVPSPALWSVRITDERLEGPEGVSGPHVRAEARDGKLWFSAYLGNESDDTVRAVFRDAARRFSSSDAEVEAALSRFMASGQPWHVDGSNGAGASGVQRSAVLDGPYTIDAELERQWATGEPESTRLLVWMLTLDWPGQQWHVNVPARMWEDDVYRLAVSADDLVYFEYNEAPGPHEYGVQLRAATARLGIDAPCAPGAVVE